MIELLYGCGLRAAEACGLEIADVDADEGIVRVTGKGGKDRVVPLGGAGGAPSGGISTRAGRRSVRPATERVFVSVRGRPLGPSDVRRAVRGELDTAGLRSARRMRFGTRSPRICSSTARTCAASSSILGHASVGTTR